MNTTRRDFIALAALAAAGASTHAQGSWAPTRPVVLVVPFSAGGPTDAIARATAERLGKSLGQPVVVENRPGAAGAIANDFVARAAPDGHTLGMIGSTMVSTAAFGQTSYHPVRSFTPIAQLLDLETILVVRADVPVRSVPELITYLKANPAKLNYGSSGNGSLTHFQMEAFKSLTGTHIVHIPYRGSSGTVQDLLGGQIQMTFDTVATLGPHIRSGALRLLAVAMPKRNPAHPGVPTVAESHPSLRDFSLMPWTGLAGPAGLPAPVVARIHHEVDALFKDDSFIQRLAAAGAAPAPATTQAFGSRISSELTRYTRMVQQLGLDKMK